MQKLFFCLSSIILFLSITAVSTVAQAQSRHIVTERTEYVHFNVPVIDGHTDTMMKVIDENTWLPATNIGEETALELDIPKAKAGGVTAPFFAAYTSGYYDNNPRSISRTLALLNALYWTEEQNPDDIKVVSTADEIRQTRKENKLAAIPSIEGAYSLEEHNALGLLQQYHQLGVKMIGFNWNYSNALGEGADRVYGDPQNTPSEGGLTELGAEVAKEMNKLGMVIDVSHMAESTFWDVLEVSEAPVIASHSGVTAIKEHQRNLTDEQLLALKENGGVISIVFFPAFITDNPEGYVDDIVDHIDYAVNLIGIDHVGLGSDFDGAALPADLQSAAETPKIINELAAREYSKQEIEQILGNNILRVLDEVEELAENSEPGSDAHPIIKPEIQMGEAINSRMPAFSAEVKAKQGTDLDKESFTIIIDGIYHQPEFNEVASTLSLQLTENLQEKFHVITFEAANTSGEMTRETRIFYVN